MAIEGTLQDMNLPTLLQFVSQQGASQSCILLQRDKERAVLYMSGHIVNHAELAMQTDTGLQTATGEEVFYDLLKWQTGKFSVKRDIPPPRETIGQTWDFLLMEGLRRIDETSQSPDALEEVELVPESALDMLSTLSAADAQAIRELIALHTEPDAPPENEAVYTVLNGLVESMDDIVGAAVVDNDGLLLASNLNQTLDAKRIATISAGLITLSDRSAQQLNYGSVSQTIVQSDDGCIIVVRANAYAFLVGLTTSTVNLGLAIVRCRQALEALSEIL